MTECIKIIVKRREKVVKSSYMCFKGSGVSEREWEIEFKIHQNIVFPSPIKI